jgi:hypothetical protein
MREEENTMIGVGLSPPVKECVAGHIFLFSPAYLYNIRDSNPESSYPHPRAAEGTVLCTS